MCVYIAIIYISTSEYIIHIYRSISIYLSLYIYIYMVFSTEGLLEVAIESWLEWDLNPRPLNSVQTL